MATSEGITRASTSTIGLELPQRNLIKETRPFTIQKPIPKTNLPFVPNSKRARRSGAISRAGHHRWPQATMVVKGGEERQVFNTEVLSVSTNQENDFSNIKYKRSNEEYETKTTLPNISASSWHKQKEQDTNQETAIPLRFAAKSPSKLTQLPDFHKNTTSDNSRTAKRHSRKEKAKLIKNIKFWRGTTPLTKEIQNIEESREYNEKRKNSNQAHAENLTKHDSILQSWNEQLSVLEETSKNKYFSWHMALRERLLKHEKMHYHEAVTRINKYRQRLRQRPGFPPIPREIKANTDIQVWNDLVQQHSKKKTTAHAHPPPGVSMSPSQEWKPYVLPEKEAATEKSHRKGAILNKPNVSSNDIEKSPMKSNSNPMQSSPSKKTRFANNSESNTKSYPVHGEGLFKDEPRSSLPSIISTSPPSRKLEETTKSNRKTEKEPEKDPKIVTKALLVDLKNQLRPKTEAITARISNDTKENIRGTTAPAQQAKKDLGAKLRLLLQKTASLQQNSDEQSREGSKSSSTAKGRYRYHVNSRSSGYRPMSRPRTFGEGSLPKIHNIISTSLWKKHGNINNTNEPSIKHRLTLAGVANRESFSSSVIGIAQKHINDRSKQTETKINDKQHNELKKKQDAKAVNDLDKFADNTEFKGFPDLSVHNASPKHNTEAEKNSDKENTKTEMLFSKSWKRKNPAYRLYTPATISQHQFSSSTSLSKIQQKENPQYKSLKLITSVPSQEQTPQTPSNKTRQAVKGHKKTAAERHKVLRIAVVEPPLTATERYQRQKQIEQKSKKLTFNATHAEVNNFTNAILNSEFNLRAPSSSPVDMFFRQHYHFQHANASFWNQSRSGDQNPRESRAKSESQGPDGDMQTNQLTINQLDGLTLPRPNINMGFEIHGIYQDENSKTSSAPKVKDLIDLQRLYHAMKKHGQAYTNGSAYLYGQPPMISPDFVNKLGQKRHTNQKNLDKTPYYYYPYADGANPASAIEENGRAPLYVVTGVNTKLSKKRVKLNQQPQMPANFSNHLVPPELQNEPSVPFRHVLTLSKTDIHQWDKPGLKREEAATNVIASSTPKHLTVMMPKTPGITMAAAAVPITPLEQIQEHVMQ